MEQVREVASAVYDASEKKFDDNARQQAVDLLSEPSSQTAAAKAAINEQLEATGTLPQLVISEFENLDGDNNGSISEQELSDVKANSETDALTRMAAEYATENFGDINGVDNWGFGLGDSEIEKSEINQFRDQARADREVEPSEMFSADRVIDEDTPETELADLLTRNASSPEQQLKAVEAMLAQGKTSFQMTDLDGNQYDVTISVQDLGNGVKVIGLLGNDDGKTYPILRGVSRNGVYSQQQNSDGPVDWYGTKWQQNHPDSAFAP